MNDGAHNPDFEHPHVTGAGRLPTASLGVGRPHRRGATVALLLVLVAPQAARAAADNAADAVANASRSTDQRMLAGLRARRGLDLAEAYFKRRLSDPNLAPRQRAELAVELVRSYALGAFDATPLQRAPWWERAHRLAADFLQREAANPFALLVQFEDARIWIDQSEVARVESQWSQTGAASASVPTADPRHALRTALRALEHLDTQLATQRRRRGRGHSADAAFSLEQLDALKKHVAYQFARALCGQGQCYAAGTPDRTNSLQQALERLAPLADLSVADHLIWRSRIDRVRCYRLLGNTSEARRRVTDLLKADPPPAIADAAHAQRIRIELASDQIDQALAAAEAVATTTGADGADLELAKLDAMLAAWRKADRQADAQTSKRLARQAADQVQRIEQRLSVYWTRRAETMLSHAMGSGSDELRALTRAAQGFYRSGKMDQAEATYDRLAQLAADQGHADRAFSAAFTAATIEHDLAEHGSDATDTLRHHRGAMTRYGKLAATFPDHPRAAEADLLAIYHAAQVARQLSGAHRQDALDQYTARIDAHLKRWPHGATAAQAQLWLGRLRQARQHWEQAIAAYRGVPPDNTHFETAIQAINRCFAQWRAEKMAAGADARPVTRAATAYYRHLLNGPRLPSDAAKQACVLALAEACLEAGDNGYGEAQQVLSEALADASPPADPWQREAQALLVVALAGQGQRAAAQHVLNQIPAGPAEPMIVLLERLAQRANRRPARPGRRALAELALHVAATISGNGIELETDMARRFQTAQAAALAAAGRRQEAIRIYAGLADRNPTDAAVQQSLAELLSSSKDPQELERGLATWRTIQRLSPVASRRWFRARYGQAQILAQQGATAQAAKMIEVTQVLHPSLGGPALRRKYEQLLERCQRPAEHGPNE